jgi:glycosyltransferase involved in cell wall biosynthesis
MLRQAASPAFHRGVTRALAVERPDCCYFIGVHPSNGVLCGQIRRRVRTVDGKPPVVAVHIHDPWPHPGLSWPLIFAAQQLMARRADRVVVYGQALTRQITRLYGVPGDRVVAIRHGASRPPREAAPAPGVAAAHFSFLGRIAGYKGLDVFLEAAQQFLARQPAARFYVAGTGSLDAYRAALRRLGAAVTMENRELSNEETDRIMQSSWAVVLPYTSGTQSGVIPVAYWNACPVITTSVGALAEGVVEGETGFVVPPRDPSAVAARMALLWGNMERRRAMGAAAFAQYDRFFRWDRIVADLVPRLSAGPH